MGLPDASPPGDEENLDGQADVHTSAPGFRPRMIVLGALWLSGGLRFLVPSDWRRSRCTMEHDGSKPKLAYLGG